MYCLAQTGAHRILQNVTQHHQQVFIALNRETLKPPLPDVSAGSIMFVITAHVTRQQPLHELTQRGFVSRFDNEVKVIGHQAETKKLKPMSLLRFAQER